MYYGPDDDRVLNSHYFNASVGTGTISSLSLCTEYTFYAVYKNRDKNGFPGTSLKARTPSLGESPV